MCSVQAYRYGFGSDENHAQEQIYWRLLVNKNTFYYAAVMGVGWIFSKGGNNGFFH